VALFLLNSRGGSFTVYIAVVSVILLEAVVALFLFKGHSGTIPVE
jgi:hypothetical protein